MIRKSFRIIESFWWLCKWVKNFPQNRGDLYKVSENFQVSIPVTKDLESAFIIRIDSETPNKKMEHTCMVCYCGQRISRGCKQGMFTNITSSYSDATSNWVQRHYGESSERTKLNKHEESTWTTEKDGFVFILKHLIDPHVICRLLWHYLPPPFIT